MQDDSFIRSGGEAQAPAPPSLAPNPAGPPPIRKPGRPRKNALKAVSLPVAAPEQDNRPRLHTGQPWERNWQIAAEDMARANGAEFVRLGSFDGLDAKGNPLPDTPAEAARIAAWRRKNAPRKARVTKADREAIERRLSGRGGEHV